MLLTSSNNRRAGTQERKYRRAEPREEARSKRKETGGYVGAREWEEIEVRERKKKKEIAFGVSRAPIRKTPETRNVS